MHACMFFVILCLFVCFVVVALLLLSTISLLVYGVVLNLKKTLFNSLQAG